MRINGIRAFLARDLINSERASELVRCQRRAMAASIAGLRAELAMLQNGGPPDLAEITRGKLQEMVANMETFDREVAVPAEIRRQKAQDRASHFETFVDRVIAA